MDFERLTLPRGLAVVVAFDICSSADIVEDLTARDAMGHYDKAIGKLKHRIIEEHQQGKKVKFDPYKFSGDGWILLYPEVSEASYAVTSEEIGASVLGLMRDLSTYYKHVFDNVLRPHLDVIPDTLGVTFGVDFGNLYPTTILQYREYVGRAINVACRLQGRANPDTALVSNPAFARYIGPADGFSVVDRKHPLKNIRRGADFHCKEIALRG